MIFVFLWLISLSMTISRSTHVAANRIVSFYGWLMEKAMAPHSSTLAWKVGCSPWGREESDMTERLHFHFSLLCIGEGNGNPLQCSSLENPRNGVVQSRTRLKWLSSSMAEWYSIVYIYHIFIIHPSVDGHLDGFHVLTVVDSALMNTGTHGSFQIMVFSWYVPRTGIFGS